MWLFINNTYSYEFMMSAKQLDLETVKNDLKILNSIDKIALDCTD